MPEQWAISSVDLHLDLGTGRIRESLEHSIRTAVQDGRLTPGTTLPSSRALAVDLHVARNTVAAVYEQLVAEGWLVALQGSGTRVAPATSSTAQPSKQTVPETTRLPYDLRPGYPDLASFPRREWLAASRTAVQRAPNEAFGYGDPRGRPELRAALASYLGRARGVRADPADIVVCSGFAQGLWLLGSVLRDLGASTVGVEDYGHARHRDLLTDTGLALTPLPVDDSGANPLNLDGLDAVLLTPAHQFPLGGALDPARRSTFASWASSVGAVVIEDDYDGEFRYQRRPVGAMQALAPQHIAYLGTASKTLAPGVRLAWMVLPRPLVPAIVARHALINAQAGALDQLTFAELLASGAYDRHIRRTRHAYHRRRDALVDTLTRARGSAGVHGLDAGLHTVVDLPTGMSEPDAVATAASRGLAIDGLDTFAIQSGSRPPALVVGFATPPPHAFGSALAHLAATIS